MNAEHVATTERRAATLRALDFFLSRHPFCRAWTFTSPNTAPASDLRDLAQSMARKLTALNRDLSKFHGVEIVFRSTEFDPSKDSAEPTRYNVHAHCVMHSRAGFILKKRRAKIAAAVASMWDGTWTESNTITPRDFTRYPITPRNVLALPADELRHVAEALKSLKTARPLGTLRDEIRARREAGKTLRRVTAQGKNAPRYREVFDFRKPRELLSGEDRRAMDALIDAEVGARVSAEEYEAQRKRSETTPSK